MIEPKQGVGKGKAQPFAVEKFEVQELVLQLHKDGLSTKQISDHLARQGVSIAPFGINRWLARQRAMETKNLQEVSKEKFDAMVIDYKNEITTILDEVKEMKKYAKDSGELIIYDKMIGRAFQGLELLAKLMGDIRPQGSVDINIVINEINQRTFEEKKVLRNSIHGGGKIIDVEAEILKEDEQEAEAIAKSV